MKLHECEDWKAVIFQKRTILKSDCKYLSSTQLFELAETEVEPTERNGYYKAVQSCFASRVG